ncbi:exonuclease domain-containing protein [Hathewaya massiliensis]|uniref:exonuclease domain-containing protein n=1 Tax=Hathewaya massiliensis TaxID=1964382 RepID=UPI00115A67BC|nr:exonuclease domain-containing protein [Hathewaya massiliensis]
MSFVCIDFETANKFYNSACSLGLVLVEEETIKESKYYLIQPPDLNFDQGNINIHGITPDEVADKPKFCDVWNEISDYILSADYVIAHNAVFDMSVLKCCLEEYNIPIPNFEYVCSIPISARAVRKLGYPTKDYKSLSNVCDLFNIKLNHHNALSDAEACAQVVINSLLTVKRKNLESFLSTHRSVPIHSFKDLEIKKNFFAKGVSKFNRVKIEDIKTDKCDFDETHPFYNKNFVFTGNLQNIDRKLAMQKVVDLGGIIKSGVSRTTNFLVVGIQDLSLVDESGMSTKEKRALELIDKGFDIKFLSEVCFLDMI